MTSLSTPPFPSVVKTPLVADLDALKLQHPDSFLAVRLGDFYEFFFEDARVVARLLGVSLTHRREAPMAGFSLAFRRGSIWRSNPGGIYCVWRGF